MPVQKWIRARLRRSFPLITAFGLVMCGLFATQAALSPSALAVGSYSNATIATDALADLGQDPAPGGGQCKAFADDMVIEASGGTQNPSGYQSGWPAAGGTLITPANAVEGDIIQITPADSMDATAVSLWREGVPSAELHTAIIVSNNGGGSFTVVDANFTATNTVGEHTFDPYTWAAGSIIDIWRMGTVSGAAAAHIVAFQANTGMLQTYDYYTGAYVDVGYGMASGTSASVAEESDGSYTLAFQNSFGNLVVWSTSGGVVGPPANLGVAPGTSPSIAGDRVAFQAAGGLVWIYNISTGAGNSIGYGAAPGTSPSLTQLSTGAYEIAFNSGVDSLDVWNSSVGGTGIGYGMPANSSPAIEALSGGGYEIAFQNSFGNLVVWSTSGGVVGPPANLGVAPGTSPSIAGDRVAFQAAGGMLWMYDVSTGAGTATGFGMAGSTSPSIAQVSGGNFTMYFQNSYGNLELWNTASGAGGPGLGLAPSTSPYFE